MLKRVWRRVWSIRRHLRFSLGTLLLVVLLIGCTGSLWHRWNPWILERSVPCTWEDEVVLSPNGALLAISRKSGEIDIYETGDWKHKTRLVSGFSERCMVEFSGDGKAILGSTNDEFRLWDLDSRRERLHILAPTEWRNHPVETFLTGDGSRIIKFAPDEGRLWVWDAESGRCVGTIHEGGPYDVDLRTVHQCGEYFVRFHLPSGKMAWNRHGLRVLDLTDLSTFAEWSLDPAAGRGFSPDGRYLYVTAESGAYCWEYASPGRPTLLQGFRPTESGAFCFSTDGASIAIACEDHKIRSWNTRTGELEQERITYPPSAWIGLFAHDDRIVVLSSHSEYDFGNGEILTAGVDDEKIRAHESRNQYAGSERLWASFQTWRVNDARLMGTLDSITTFFNRVLPEAGHLVLAADGQPINFAVVFDLDTLERHFLVVGHEFIGADWERKTLITKAYDGIVVWHQWREAGTAGIMKLPDTWLAIVLSAALLFRFSRYVSAAIRGRQGRKRTTGRSVFAPASCPMNER